VAIPDAAPAAEPRIAEPPVAVIEVEEVEVVEAIAPIEPVTEISEPEALADTAAAEEAEEAVAEAEEWLDEAEVPPIVAEVTDSVPVPAEPIRSTEPAATAEPTAAPFDLGTAGMIAGAALALLLVALLVARRRRSEPEGMDVTILAEAGEADDDERIPLGGFSMDARADQELPPETFEPETVSRLHEMETSIPPRSSAPEAAPGIFDEELEEKEAMDMDNQDLPITHIDPEAPTQMGIGAASVGGAEPGVARMFQEFERRIAHLEARLDESVEARERLERQVSAQNEELRVQRAAIARTQRALRSLNRTEEEQATEPALRDQSPARGSE
jgi:hypothetical protein